MLPMSWKLTLFQSLLQSVIVQPGKYIRLENAPKAFSYVLLPIHFFKTQNCVCVRERERLKLGLTSISNSSTAKVLVHSSLWFRVSRNPLFPMCCFLSWWINYNFWCIFLCIIPLDIIFLVFYIMYRQVILQWNLQILAVYLRSCWYSEDTV